MWHEQFEHQHVATTMEIGCLHSQDVENTVEMAASSSKMFQTARWDYRTGDPKKNPKRNLWYHLNISFIECDIMWVSSKPQNNSETQYSYHCYHSSSTIFTTTDFFLTIPTVTTTKNAADSRWPSRNSWMPRCENRSVSWNLGYLEMDGLQWKIPWKSGWWLGVAMRNRNFHCFNHPFYGMSSF